MIELLNGNALHIPLKDNSVHCIVTSPPYWGLRDYGVGNQLGLEPTPEEYTANMVQVFRELWRILRDDGTAWLVIGDSYNGSGGAGGDYNKGGLKEGQPKYPGRNVTNLKPKDLVGIPWRVAFALQADGWYLRNDIIWHKPNPMPESVTDRCTKSHEYVFLLTKSARYYYDNEAVKENSSDPVGSAQRYQYEFSGRPKVKITPNDEYGQAIAPEGFREFSPTRNLRDVWTVTTKPYSGAHFATYPPDLIEPCIKAGTSEAGVCPECGAQWERVTKRIGSKSYRTGKSADKASVGLITAFSGYEDGSRAPKFITTGWQPTCEHGHDAVTAIVFDPFIGSGTTCMVARAWGRSGIGLDLSMDYLINNARKRLQLSDLDAWLYGSEPVEGNYHELPLFTT